MLDRLSSPPILKRLIIGANVAGNTATELELICSRSYSRLGDNVAAFICGEYPYDSKLENGEFEQRLKELEQVTDANQRHYLDNELRQTFRFPLDSESDTYFLELSDYPKVKFIHFRKELQYERSWNAYGTHSVEEDSSQLE